MIERIWQSNLRILAGVVKSLLPDYPWVEDILQESFTRVLAARCQFKDEREAFNFIRRTVINTSIEQFRQSIRQRRLGNLMVSFLSQQINQTGPIDDPLTQLIGEERNSEKVLLMKEIERSLTQLPGEQREAIEIIFNRRPGQKVKATCQRRGIPYSTVRSRMLAGIDRIRRELRLRGVFTKTEEKHW